MAKKSSLKKGVILLTLFVSILLLIDCSWQGIKQIGQTTPGFTFYNDGYVASLIHPKWPGTLAGLHKGDLILSYDGILFHSRDELLAYVQAQKPNSGFQQFAPIAYEVKRGEQILQLSIAPMTFTHDDFILVTLSCILVAVVLLFSSAFLFFLRPDLTSNFSFCLHTCSVALIHILLIDFYIDQKLFLPLMLSFCFFTVTSPSTAVYLYEVKPFFKKHPYFFAGLAGLAFPLTIFAYFLFQYRHWPLQGLLDIMCAFLFFSFAATLLITVSIWITASSKITAKRILILTPAFTVGLLPGSTYYVMREFANVILPAELILFYFYYSLFFLLAIIWVNAMEFNLQPKRSTLNAAFGIISMLFVTVHLIYAPVILRKYQINPVHFQWFLFAYILSQMFLVFGVIQTRLFDRLFFSSTYYLPQVLQNTHNKILRRTSRPEIVQILIHCLEKKLEIEKAYCYLSKQSFGGGGDFYFQKLLETENETSSSLLPKVIPFDKDTLLKKDFIPQTFSGSASNFELTISQLLAQLPLDLVMPICSEQEVLGLVLFGKKLNTTPYTPEDISNLKIILSTTALAIMNVENYEIIRDLEARLRQENKLLKQEIHQKIRHEEIIGREGGLKDVFDHVEMLRGNLSTVLLRGESGTGKEVVARAVHKTSLRAEGPFIGVNCSAIPNDLLESELFGHEKGSFTGAFEKKIGLFEMAAKGTLFLDEIGDLPLPLQAKLLRVLQEKEMKRLGGDQFISVDVRIIAATNRNLEDAIAKKRFREDLYYRLNVVPIFIPPLRDRKQDIEDLVHFFVKKFSQEMNKRVLLPDRETLKMLKNYDWPGNVRELQNVIERSIALCAEGQGIKINNLEGAFWGEQPSHKLDEIFNVPTYQEQLQNFQKLAIRQAIKKAQGNKAAAARELGIHVTHLHRMIKSLKLSESK